MLSLFVNRLTVIDFALLNAQAGLLGESWLVDITITGELDEQGMLFDFGFLKKQAKAFIESHYDHKLLVPLQDPQLQLTTTEGQVELIYQYQKKSLIHQSPETALALIATDKITTSIIENKLSTQLMDLMPKNVESVGIKLYTESSEDYYYQYCHGLKKHQGDCQRIAHGHRSKIEIYCDGKRNKTIEKKWIEKWRGIYIGTIEDCVDPSADILEFSYQSSQGFFRLQIPAVDCCLIKRESTVENIAQFIAQYLKIENPHSHYQINAFEGVDKGAIAIL